MTIELSFPSPTQSDLEARIALLEHIVDSALNAGHRHVEQFARLAALARAVANDSVSANDRTILTGTLESIARHAELDATLDVEFFGGVRAGQVISRLVRMTRDRPSNSEPCAESADPVSVTTH
jgi:hypothetical protein